MRTTAQVGDGPTATTQGVLTKAPSGEVSVPLHFRTLEGAESIALGFRQAMFELKTDDGIGGEVATGSGWGTDAIIMTWYDGKVRRQAVVRGLDLLQTWVRTFDPDAAAQFPA